MFKIEEKNNKYTVIPTAGYVLDHFDKFSFPYDSNWEIYKLFNYSAEDFFKFVIAAYNAEVVFQYTFPWVNIYFSRYTDAENFKKEVEKRAMAA